MTLLFSEEKIQTIHRGYLQRLPSFGKSGVETARFIRELPEVERICMEFCYTFMPVQDFVSYPFQLIDIHVKHAVMLLNTVPWLKNIPEDIFLNFVLFYRVNNEFIEDYKNRFFEELWPRVRDKSDRDAILEVNYWCYEKATYKESDDRTASPLTVIRRTYGRCGEESTLLVSALRSVGLPARQCYTPRWAHCDDNHAWVEAYSNGKWHYLGACEPEPVLDKGWFTAAASKAMLIHSKVFNSDMKGELIADRTPVFCMINNLKTYAKTTCLNVFVRKDNRPFAGAVVRCEIVNYSELYPLLTAETDDNGFASFVLGKGDIILHVHDGNHFLMKKVDLRRQSEITVDFDEAVENKPGNFDFELIPPAEDLSNPVEISRETAEMHEKRLEHCNRVRLQTEMSFAENPALKNLKLDSDWDKSLVKQYLTDAKGNFDEIIDFLQCDSFTTADKAAILNTLREKDFVDITSETLKEYLEASLPYKGLFPEDVYIHSVLAPRIENEMILPQRKQLKAFFDRFSEPIRSASQLWDYLRKAVILQDEYGYDSLVCDAKNILSTGICDSHSLDILFVSAARSLGIPARINSSTGRKEFYDGEKYCGIGEDSKPVDRNNSRLIIRNQSGKDLNYFSQISIGKFSAGVYHSLVYWNQTIGEIWELPVEAGEYRVITTVRQIDGSVKCKVYFISVPKNQSVVLPVDLAKEDILGKLKYAKIENVPLMSESGENTDLYSELREDYTILAFADPGKEPTEHLFNEWIRLAEKYRSPDLGVMIVLDDRRGLQNPTLQKVLQAIPGTRVLIMDNPRYLKEFHLLMGVGDERKPFVLVINNHREGLYAFSNYNVGTGQTLLNIISEDSSGRKSEKKPSGNIK